MEVFMFPFDRQMCNVSIMLRLGDSNTVQLVSDSDAAVTYKGPENLRLFRVGMLNWTSDIVGMDSKFIFSIELDRLYSEFLVSIFFQTFLLWLLAFFTLFIRLENFNERIMGGITVLLVLVSLLAYVQSSVPTTSGLILIDIWFVWFITRLVRLMTRAG
ncbi:uncharacterized protein LOC111701898 [Eurytemora carolleeae]|uniref:uncharacterized protein LOC111701898 n=1 Tax=Eurytemora carolleeae TaxID=1294199 RepID=UPI000C77BBF0|nr:uncharacterized protein LOC111701898 [Eurytemora carolleeae]|eukprot:XP_023329144.1 uncharacterized protein LOC111701898 [Eurytemora affinis]